MITAVLGIATIGALGWALYNVFAATMSSLNALASAGWAEYVGADAANTLGFLFKCFMDSQCGAVLGPQWAAHYSLLPVLIFPPALIATIIAARISARPSEQKAPGHAHWGTIAELKREGYVKTKEGQNARGYFGIHKDSRKIVQLPEHIRFSHCLVIGGPGARKSTGYHKQNIIQDMRDGVNIIVFDLKYPDPRGGFFDMVTLAADEYDYNVQLMLPYDKVTHRYSFLTKATTEAGAREVASMILPPGEGSEGSAYYRNNERILLTGLILAAARKENGSLKEIVDILRLGYKAMGTFVKEAQDPDVTNMIATVLDGLDTEKQKGIINGLLGKLEIFGDPDLLAFGQLSRDPRENIDLRRFANAKTILYIGVPQQKLGPNGQMFLQLIKRSIDNELGEISRENAGVFPIPISYYLDEFANFGPLPDIGADFATMRSRRLSYHVTVQNMAQGAAVYGHQEWESFYRSNFQSVLIFPRYIRFGDADLFSKFAGNLTTIEQSTSDSKGGLESRTSVNTREVSRPLMSTEEMKEWPQAEGVAFLNGVAPVRVVLPRLDEAHVRGYKNPYHDDYLRIPDKLNPIEWIAERFNRLAADRRQVILQAKLEEAQARIAEKRAKEEHAQRAHEITVTARPVAPRRPEDDELPAPAPAQAAPAPQPSSAPSAAPTATPPAAAAPQRPVNTAPAKGKPAPAVTEPAPEQPKGVKRFNLIIGALIKERITPSALKVSKGKRLLELAFPLNPDVEARIEPYRDLLVKHSKFMVERGKEIALTRAGFTYLSENYTAYYYRLGVKDLSRQQRAALADPEGPNVQMPLSHNAVKDALRKEIRRLNRGKHLKWRVTGGEAELTVAIGKVDANRLHVYGAYWKQLALAVERDGLLRIRPRALTGLPKPALDALPPMPQLKPQPKTDTKNPQADQSATATQEPQASQPAAERPRGNDPRAAAKRLSEAPPFPDTPTTEPPAQADKKEPPQRVDEGAQPTSAPEAQTPPPAEPESAPAEVEASEAPGATPPGLKPMPADVRQPAASIVSPGQDSDADTIALIEDAYDRAAIGEWVTENKARLWKHPEMLEGLARNDMLGKYGGAHFLVPIEVARKRLAASQVNEIPPTLKRSEHRIKGHLSEWVIVDPDNATTSEDMMLIYDITMGQLEGAIRVESMLEIPLDVAMQLADDIDWSSVQAVMRGPRAWVKVYVVDPKPVGENAEGLSPAATETPSPSGVKAIPVQGV